MKRIIALLVAALLVGAVSVDAAKKKSSRKTAAPAAAVVVGPQTSYPDGLVFRSYSIKKKVRVLTFGHTERLECSFALQYPESGSQPAVDAMRNWIVSRIKGIYNKAYTGSASDPKALVQWAARQWQDEQNIITAKPVYCNDKMVTYCIRHEYYGGGAHGATSTCYATFLLSDGRMLTNADMPSFSRWNILSKLATAFDMSTSETKDLLFDTPTEYPSRNPFVMGDGVHIIWGQYEITPFACGEPEVVLSNNPADFAGTPAAAYF